jgi:peptidoglycan/xylan/chitin deacetylase (PgdA/CDA1 family)
LKFRLAALIVLIFLTLIETSCSGTYEGKPTGIKYILSQGSPKKSPEKIPDKQEVLPVSPSEHLSIPPLKPSTVVPSGNETAYLTFDDGPNNTETPIILDILDSYGVKGTFFVIGSNIEQYPDILKEVISRGHAVGNHTYDHKYSEVYASHAAFLDSIKKNEDLIFQIGGIRPKIVRDPGGEVRNNKVLKGLLAQNGYTLMDWNIDSYDSRKPGPDGAQIVENVRRQAENPRIRSNAVILMHDGTGHINTVRALPTIIEVLKSQGFKFATLK